MTIDRKKLIAAFRDELIAARVVGFPQNCTILFTEVLRKMGLPARAVTGLALSSNRTAHAHYWVDYDGVPCDIADEVVMKVLGKVKDARDTTYLESFDMPAGYVRLEFITEEALERLHASFTYYRDNGFQAWYEIWKKSAEESDCEVKTAFLELFKRYFG
jgi:hypothetical protein